jgi:hypothetical protein
LYNKRDCCRIFSWADYTIIDLYGGDMTPKIDDLTKKMGLARSRLNSAMEKITPQDDIYPSWKLKQLMDHITGWDVLVASSFNAISRGDAPEPAEAHDFDAYNAASLQDRKQLSLEQSRQAYHAARDEVLRALNKIPDVKLTQKHPAPWGGKCTVASVLRIFITHELEHAKQIEEKLNNFSGSVS